MLIRLILVILTIILALIGCTNQNQSEMNRIQQTKILFFSDAKDIEKEVPYYDALLDLKNDFPKQIDNLEVKKNKHGWEDEIKSLPALIIVHKHRILFKIEGYIIHKKEILEPLRSTLNKINIKE